MKRTELPFPDADKLEKDASAYNTLRAGKGSRHTTTSAPMLKLWKSKHCERAWWHIRPYDVGYEVTVLLGMLRFWKTPIEAKGTINFLNLRVFAKSTEKAAPSKVTPR